MGGGTGAGWGRTSVDPDREPDFDVSLPRGVDSRCCFAEALSSGVSGSLGGAAEHATVSRRIQTASRTNRR